MSDYWTLGLVLILVIAFTLAEIFLTEKDE